MSTPLQQFAGIRSRYAASQGLRRLSVCPELADRYEAEWRGMVRACGYAPSVVARETGIELQELEEGL